jgi:hypothetical protein
VSFDSVTERFSRLRSMREALCQKEKNWSEAFEARDWILGQLKELQAMCTDPNMSPEDIENRVCDLICVLEPKGSDDVDK